LFRIYDIAAQQRFSVDWEFGSGLEVFLPLDLLILANDLVV
jgi:hypothetical protein